MWKISVNDCKIIENVENNMAKRKTAHSEQTLFVLQRLEKSSAEGASERVCMLGRDNN